MHHVWHAYCGVVGSRPMPFYRLGFCLGETYMSMDQAPVSDNLHTTLGLHLFGYTNPVTTAPGNPESPEGPEITR